MRFTEMLLLFLIDTRSLQGRLIELSAADHHPVANFHIGDNPILAARDKNKRTLCPRLDSALENII